MAAFYSNDTLGKVRKAVKSLLPMLRSEHDKAVLEFGLTEVQGVGFASDFRIYSKIKPKNWANASPGGALTSVQPTNLIVTASGVVSTNGSVTSGSTFLAQDTGVSSAFVSVGGGDNVALPTPTEAIEAEAADDSALLSPKAVFHELERVPTTFSLLDIDRKIALYQAVGASVRSDAGGGIRNALLDVQHRLRARLEYRNDPKVRAFFDKYQTTTCEAIDKLLDKYEHLRIGPADDFIPEMPDDALTAIAGYTKMCAQIAKFKPVYYLIAPASEFKRKAEVNKRRDPILLVQSPFGFFWQILGAWGPEMRMLEEI